MWEVRRLDSWQQRTAVVLLLCQGVSGASDPFIISCKRATQKKAPDYSAVEQNGFTSQQEAVHFFFLSQGKTRFAILSGQGKELVEGGGGSRKDTISQLSTPAWFSGVSGKGFHTWGNNRVEVEDGIKFLHCYPSVCLHQGRWWCPLQALKLAHALKEQHSVLHSLNSSHAHFSPLALFHLVRLLGAFLCHSNDWIELKICVWLFIVIDILLETLKMLNII